MGDGEQRRATLTGLQVLRLGAARRWRALRQRVVAWLQDRLAGLLDWMLDLDRPAWLRRLGRQLTRRDSAETAAMSPRERQAIAAFKNARAVTPPPQPQALGAHLRPGKQRILADDEALQRQVSDGISAQPAWFKRKPAATPKPQVEPPRQLDGTFKKP